MSDSRVSGRRVSLRTIAQAAHVSVMTVSYALRKSPEVSAAEQVRIQAVADRLGYRPDPLLTHLMQHLRSQRTLKSTANLAVLTTLEAGFVQRLVNGARQRAERLGYTLDRIATHEFAGKPRSLTRVLEARGVRGVLLAPAKDPAGYVDLLDWSRFAAVAMTYSVVEPRVHRVVTHHYDNALRTLALLNERGYRRIGLAMTRDMEFRANHSYSGAYHRAAGMGECEPLPVLFLDEVGKAEIRTWRQEHRPDVVLLANANHLRESFVPALGARACDQLRFVSLDHEEGQSIPGMDQMFELIGGHAVDALVGQLHRSDVGLPENPTVTMVEGRWREATPLPRGTGRVGR